MKVLGSHGGYYPLTKWGDPPSSLDTKDWSALTTSSGGEIRSPRDRFPAGEKPLKIGIWNGKLIWNIWLLLVYPGIHVKFMFHVFFDWDSIMGYNMCDHFLVSKHIL